LDYNLGATPSLFGIILIVITNLREKNFKLLCSAEENHHRWGAVCISKTRWTEAWFIVFLLAGPCHLLIADYTYFLQFGSLVSHPLMFMPP